MAQKVRQTGLNLPWSMQQMFSWVIFIYSTIVFFVQIVPNYDFTQFVIITVIVSVSLLLVFIYDFLLTTSNPTDPVSLVYLSTTDESYKKKLTDSTARHCSYCDAPVSDIKTKHCLRCNRCTLKFDHHCKFVNNCIGSVNYHLFLKLILFVEIHEFIMCALIGFYLCSNYLKINPYYIFIFIAFIKSFLVLSFNGYLVIFHIYLLKNRLSTYDYIIERRKIKTFAII